VALVADASAWTTTQLEVEAAGAHVPVRSTGLPGVNGCEPVEHRELEGLTAPGRARHRRHEQEASSGRQPRAPERAALKLVGRAVRLSDRARRRGFPLRGRAEEDDPRRPGELEVGPRRRADVLEREREARPRGGVGPRAAVSRRRQSGGGRARGADDGGHETERGGSPRPPAG
jgi:hypothetical protein